MHVAFKTSSGAYLCRMNSTNADAHDSGDLGIVLKAEELNSRLANLMGSRCLMRQVCKDSQVIFWNSYHLTLRSLRIHRCSIMKRQQNRLSQIFDYCLNTVVLAF